MRFADGLAVGLKDLGVDTVFSVTGGGAMHLNDAFGRLPELRKVYCHNEQACAIAADSYARIKKQTSRGRCHNWAGRNKRLEWRLRRLC